MDLDVPDPDAGCSIDGVADSANTLVVLDQSFRRILRSLSIARSWNFNVA